MFGIGGVELILILVFGFLIFGPDKLPAIAKTVGQAIAKFKGAQEEMSKVIKTEVYDPTSDEPFKNPLEALSKLEEDKKKNEKTESFSERKAKYDKERAAKKAEEEKAAAEKPEEKAGSAATATGAVASVAAASAEKPLVRDEVKASTSDVSAKPRADELFGNTPPAKTATTAKTTRPATAKPTTTRSTQTASQAATTVKPEPATDAAIDATTEEKGE
ncbi:MAG: twin-arginine translocase TatA/TatE family subunit [Raoultibacter sp.]